MFYTCTAVVTGRCVCEVVSVVRVRAVSRLSVNFGIHLLACLNCATDISPLVSELLKLLHDNKFALFSVLIIVFSTMCCSRFPLCWINVMNK